MKFSWQRLAPLGLYLSLLAALVAAGLYIVQREFTLPLQISLGLVVIGLALFAALDPERVREALTGRQARYGSNALVMSLAFIGILVVINYLVFENPKRWDLTENEQFTLAPETIDTLQSLPQPVVAQAFYTPDLPSDTAVGLMDQYEFHSEGNFDYEVINPIENPVAAQEAGIESNGTVVLRMGENQELVTLVNERELTSALVRLMNPEQSKIYFLTGHGEFDPQGTDERSYSQARQALEGKNYAVENLNLLSTHQIPEDARVIVIAGPLQPVSQEEVELLKGFVESGGALIVMEEPSVLTEFGESPDPLAAYLAENWDIQLGENMIVDPGVNPPSIAVADRYSQHVITDKLRGLVSIYPTARSVVPAEETDLNLVRLVETSSQAWAETNLEALRSALSGGDSSQIQADEETDLLGPVPVVVIGEDFNLGARVAVFGDADFATDAYFGQYGNGDVLVNTIDWAAEQEDLINLTPKEDTPRLLVPPGAYTMNLILLGSVFILPGLVLVAGAVVFFQRRRRG